MSISLVFIVTWLVSCYHLPVSSGKCFSTKLHKVCLIAGISMLQGGPMPSFFSDEQLQKLLQADTLVHSEAQFRDGLNFIGVVDVSNILPFFTVSLRSITCVVPLYHQLRSWRIIVHESSFWRDRFPSLFIPLNPLYYHLQQWQYCSWSCICKCSWGYYGLSLKSSDMLAL